MPITINGKVYRNLEDQVKYLTDELDDLNDILAYIPVDATAQNKLATRSYVDQSVTTVAAHYLTSDVEGDNFPTKAALLTGPYYYGAEEHVPDENDYAFVNADEDHDDLPSRYAYINDAWQYQYSLQASSGVVDLTSAQTITGVKTFTNGIKVNNNTSLGSNNAGASFKWNDVSYLDVRYDGVYPVAYYSDMNLGGAGNKWKDLYLSGQAYFKDPSAGVGWSIGVDPYSCIFVNRGSDVKLYMSSSTFEVFGNIDIHGEIANSYKEANEVTISGNIATAYFDMNADTVNKIKYLEIFIGSDTIVSSFIIPVAAWNMSEWTSSTSIEAQPVPVSVMFNSNGLYVAISDTGSTSIQVFAKMI